MRFLVALVAVSALVGFQGQAEVKDAKESKAAIANRYGVDPEPKTYPQGTAKDALGSVLRAIRGKRIDYLLSQLTDPAFVDQQVASNAPRLGANVNEAQKKGLAFNQLVLTTTDAFHQDPTKITELQRFYDEGEWQEEGNDAVATLKGLQARKVFMKKITPDRWVLLNREK